MAEVADSLQQPVPTPRQALLPPCSQTLYVCAFVQHALVCVCLSVSVCVCVHAYGAVFVRACGAVCACVCVGVCVCVRPNCLSDVTSPVSSGSMVACQVAITLFLAGSSRGAVCRRSVGFADDPVHLSSVQLQHVGVAQEPSGQVPATFHCCACCRLLGGP